MKYRFLNYTERPLRRALKRWEWGREKVCFNSSSDKCQLLPIARGECRRPAHSRKFVFSILLCMVQFYLLPSPPGHTPGDLQFFGHLAVYSPPPGTQKETIPHPRDSSSTTNTLFSSKTRRFGKDLNYVLEFIERRTLHV